MKTFVYCFSVFMLTIYGVTAINSVGTSYNAGKIALGDAVSFILTLIMFWLLGFLTAKVGEKYER